MTITEFLLARMAEKERMRMPYWHRADCPMVDDARASCACGAGEQIRAECRAERVILFECSPARLEDYDESASLLADIVIRALARAYRDHPDYDPAWASNG